MLPLLRCFFARLLILQYPDYHQNLIRSSLYYSGPVHKISSQSVHNFLSNVVHRQTNKQTDRQTDKVTNATKKHNLLCQGGNCQGGNDTKSLVLRESQMHLLFSEYGQKRKRSRSHPFLSNFFTSRPFLKMAGGIVMGSIAVSAVSDISAVSADVLPYILVAIKASLLKLGMCNICKNNVFRFF